MGPTIEIFLSKTVCNLTLTSTLALTLTQVMHTVLGIAEQVRFCDAKVNPTYNGRQDDYRNPINCTWGFHRPPKMGAEGACLPSLQANYDLRNGEIKRAWTVHSREAWSTRDRAGYLYRNYM